MRKKSLRNVGNSDNFSLRQTYFLLLSVTKYNFTFIPVATNRESFGNTIVFSAAAKSNPAEFALPLVGENAVLLSFKNLNESLIFFLSEKQKLR